MPRDLPLAELTFRKYERPTNLKERELVRKLCLSMGFLQPGDSRDVVVDVLHVLLKAQKRKKELSVGEIEQKVVQNRKLHRVPLLGVASSNIRRQIKRLRTQFVVEKMKTKYRITEFSPMLETFEEKIEPFLLKTMLQRVKEYLAATDEQFSRHRRENSNI